MKFETNYLNEYIAWLKDKSFGEQISDNVFRLSMPYLNQHNDYTELFIKLVNDKFHISDNCETLSTLELDGVNFKTGFRKDLLTSILESHGVKRDGAELYTVSNKSDLFIKKHMFFQAISKVNDLFYTSRKNVENCFNDDVMSFFDKNEIRYNTNILVAGTSGLPFEFDFSLPKYKDKKERFIKTINHTRRENIVQSLFIYKDVIETKENSDFIVIYNDNDSVSPDISAFENYGITAFPFTKLNDNLICFN